MRAQSVWFDDTNWPIKIFITFFWCFGIRYIITSFSFCSNCVSYRSSWFPFEVIWNIITHTPHKQARPSALIVSDSTKREKQSNLHITHGEWTIGTIEHVLIEFRNDLMVWYIENSFSNMRHDIGNGEYL
jgi:hypothetical protein